MYLNFKTPSVKKIIIYFTYIWCNFQSFRSAEQSQLSAGVDWAAWHLPGGPVGPPARWAATSNAEGGNGTEEGARALR